jgi:hypothetical protein
VRKHLEAALAHEGVGRSVEDVLEKIATGHAQMWAGKKSFHITEIIVHPNRKTLHVWLSGGDMQELIEMAPKLMAWGKKMGCTDATIAIDDIYVAFISSRFEVKPSKILEYED